ncbi:hypothetical protein BDF14DRAFT_1488818 [Spinellus fusiger]|nr:hypothetical protein BDF14DRAFT_1488818 [Spinellus fusiger]
MNPQQSQVPPLPEGWVALWDQNAQRYYYLETATGKTQWEVPAGHSGGSQSGGYPPQSGGYPPQSGGYPPQSGYSQGVAHQSQGESSNYLSGPSYNNTPSPQQHQQQSPYQQPQQHHQQQQQPVSGGEQDKGLGTMLSSMMGGGGNKPPSTGASSLGKPGDSQANWLVVHSVVFCWGLLLLRYLVDLTTITIARVDSVDSLVVIISLLLLWEAMAEDLVNTVMGMDTTVTTVTTVTGMATTTKVAGRTIPHVILVLQQVSTTLPFPTIPITRYQ